MQGKKVLLGVTGSIAAYKSALLIRLLVKSGAEVRVIMTDSAKDFITPLTLSVLSRNPVLSSYFDPGSGLWNNHVELGMWADILLVAPASANTIAKMSSGICDNLLLAVYLSSKCPVVIAPAMDMDMLNHSATRENLRQLKSRGVRIVEPSTGELASGLSGEGRLQEPEDIELYLRKMLSSDLPLKGKKALVTAGPTYEALDPVRFFGNRSSGKMGFALAEELSKQGANVVLVTGPTSLSIMNPSIHRIDVESTDAMHKACMKHFRGSDIVIMAAAVADYKPESTSERKIKKKNVSFSVNLVQTIDILSEMGKKKTKKQILVGFALETDQETANAKSKLERKNLDFIVLNSLKDKGAGFGHDTNKVKLISNSGKTISFDLKSKTELARDIIGHLIRKIVK